MKSPESVAAARLGRSIAATLLVIAAGATAAAADGGTARSGGLVPGPRKTRAELIREWDLNSDGKIDAGEAEMAASRMRRERADLRLNSGIDPITGLPRGEEDAAQADEQTPDADADVMPEEQPADDDVRRDEDERSALPGTRVPRPRLPGTEKPTDKKNLNAGRKPVGPAAVDRSRQPLTGGTRAGGMPASAGYGSGMPSRPLNAGMPIVPKTRVIVPTPTPTPTPTSTSSRGGLGPPGRPSATVTRPATPTPPRPAPSREVYNPY